MFGPYIEVLCRVRVPVSHLHASVSPQLPQGSYHLLTLLMCGELPLIVRS